MLQRQPGTKESRYAHLLSGEPQEARSAPVGVLPSSTDNDRIGRLEAELAELRRELHELRQEFGEFKKQF